MANRFPLVLANNQIQEIANGDNLDLTGNDIVNVDNIQVQSSITINGQTLSGTIDYNDIQNKPTIPTLISQLTNDVSFGSDFTQLANKPTTIAGYGITDAFSGNYTDLAGKPTALSQFVNDTNFITLADVTGTIDVNPTGDLTGSVFADDSTLLVDAVNGKIPAANLEGELPALDGSNLTNVTINSLSWTNITGTPTTLAGYGITDAFDGAFSSLTGNPTTIAGYGITDAFDGDYTNLTNAPTIPSDLTDLGILDGTNGQFLMTNGDGQFSFETVSGGSVGTLQQVIDAGNTSTTTAVIPFLYSNQAAFPSASTYHGAIAHSHADGAMYFAHSGSWHKLANDADIPTTPSLQDVTTAGATTTDAVIFNGGITSTTISAESFTSTGTGVPAVESATDLDLEAGNNIYLKINSNTIATVSSTGLAANLTGNVTGTLDGDVSGSVFADDSTLMVDAVNNAMITDMMTLTPISAEPSSPVVGMIVVADYTNWDPLSTSVNRPYVVFYDGAVWQALSPI